jgi:hypothetical protein
MKTRDEHAEQVALFRWAAIARARYPELALLYAIPNGGHRHIQVARRLKAEGVKAGVPDICRPVPRGNWCGLYIELKTARGAVSIAQRGWLKALQDQGYRVGVCRGWEPARTLIEDYLATGTDAGRCQRLKPGSRNGESYECARG